MANRNPNVIGWLLVVVLVVLAIISGTALSAANTANDNTRSIRAGAIAQCQRLQEQRDEDNATAFRQKQVIVTLAHTLENQGILDVLKTKNRGLRIDDVKALEHEASAIRYQPPTDCVKAIDLGERYRRPRAIPFPPNFKP